jgi:hypothetical protein
MNGSFFFFFGGWWSGFSERWTQNLSNGTSFASWTRQLFCMVYGTVFNILSLLRRGWTLDSSENWGCVVVMRLPVKFWDKRLRGPAANALSGPFVEVNRAVIRTVRRICEYNRNKHNSQKIWVQVNIFLFYSESRSSVSDNFFFGAKITWLR